jgi:N-acetylglutamate synthase-like GNAT family acetyltransferase
VVTSLPPAIRAAAESDAVAIRALIRDARLNPRDLDWRRFLVADDAGRVVACAQFRVHRHGTRELASVAVVPSRRGHGLGRAIAEAAIAREPARPVFLYTESRTAAFWEKLGFRTVDGDAVPADLRGPLLIGRIATVVYSLFVRHRLRIVVMRRD